MAHGYYRIDYEVIWEIITNRLPGLEKRYRKNLKRGNPAGERIKKSHGLSPQSGKQDFNRPKKSQNLLFYYSPFSHQEYSG